MFTVSILWEKNGNEPQLETANARYKFKIQAHKPPSFRVTSQDESDQGMGQWHFCFSTKLSQHQSNCRGLQLKIQDRVFEKNSGGGSNHKCRGSAWTKFCKRSTDVIPIESNHWNENSLN